MTPNLSARRAAAHKFRDPGVPTRTRQSARSAAASGLSSAPPRAGAGGRISTVVPMPPTRKGLRLGGTAMDPELRTERPLVLLAEDEAIIAIDLEDSLQAAGFAVAGPFATCAQAEAWLETGIEPDAAILDHVLKDGPCDSLVRDLSRRGVPTIIFTGHDARRQPAAEVSTATWVTKPVAFPGLLDILRRRMQART